MHDVLAGASVWHQHQPYYPDDIGGENPMPWVRLHGTKDYWGMAMLLDEVPEVHATINLVPSLLVQLAAYAEPGRQDEHLRVSRLPADGLSERDMTFLLDNFFMVHPEHMIRPYPRYHELFQKRGLTVDPAERARKRFTKRDIVDLQCWSNLVWIHPVAFERDKELAEFREKGRHWTEAEKQWLLGKQLELLREVVPLHRRLQERGQVELTTSPFYHPILPLLMGQASGAAGDARSGPPPVPRQLPRGRPRADPPRGGVPREDVRGEAAGDVAFGRLGLPGDDSADRRGRDPVDRHRRGDPLLLDRELGLARRQRLPAQPGDALPAVARGRGRAGICRSSSATTR